METIFFISMILFALLYQAYPINAGFI